MLPNSSDWPSIIGYVLPLETLVYMNIMTTTLGCGSEVLQATFLLQISRHQPARFGQWHSFRFTEMYDTSSHEASSIHSIWAEGSRGPASRPGVADSRMFLLSLRLIWFLGPG